MKRISKSTKLTIQVIMSMVLIITGVILLFLGFYTSPVGSIHDSILIAYGEVSTFAGSLLGLDYNYKYKIFKAGVRFENIEEDEEEEDK